MNKVQMLVDSGAYTIYKKKINLGLKDYMAFLEKVEENVHRYIALDVIPTDRNPGTLRHSAAASFENYKEMVAAGFKPLPVIHCNEPLDYIKKSLDAGADYIALGLPSPKAVPGMRAWLDQAYALMVNEGAIGKVKIHGLSMGAFQMMHRYPFDSCDSSIFSQAAGYGLVLLPAVVPVHGKLEFDYTKLPGKVRVSNAMQSGLDCKTGSRIHAMRESLGGVVSGIYSQYFAEMGVEQSMLERSYNARCVPNLIVLERCGKAARPMALARIANDPVINASGKLKGAALKDTRPTTMYACLSNLSVGKVSYTQPMNEIKYVPRLISFAFLRPATAVESVMIYHEYCNKNWAGKAQLEPAKRSLAKRKQVRLHTFWEL